ncbi:MAG: hypothetical protein LBC42_00440 [Puniceicoccales bacterium]|nr:hypothetical protein [Puniceicoccales bacterium]
MPFLLPFAIVFGNGGVKVELESTPEIALGEIVGAQRSAVFTLWQGIESRCVDSSGLFVQGNINKEFDRRDEITQRITTNHGGSIGKEWVYESPQARTHYGIMFNHSKNKSRFYGDTKQAEHEVPLYKAVDF